MAFNLKLSSLLSDHLWHLKLHYAVYLLICFISSSCSALPQATEEVSKSLVAMKEILYGTNEKEPQTEAVAQLAQELYNSGLLSTLIADLQLIDFEVRREKNVGVCVCVVD